MTCRSEMLALVEMVLDIIDSSRNLEEARKEVVKLHAKIKVGAYDEFLNKL